MGLKLLPTLVKSVRFLSAQKLPKRFYKEVSVVGAGTKDGGYEICLDHRKVRTPKGSVLNIPSLPLAHAIAKEWDMQVDEIQMGRMHLHGLAVTSTDNPNQLDKEWIVDRLVDVLLPSDTILYFAPDNEALRQRQEEVWGNFLDWAAATHGIHIAPSNSIALPDIKPEPRQLLRSHLASYNFWALNGYVFGAETIKSILLTWGCVNGRLSVEEAVSASLLETEHQTERWGNVEWGHDVEREQQRNRLAAAILFVCLNSESYSAISKATSSAVAN